MTKITLKASVIAVAAFVLSASSTKAQWANSPYNLNNIYNTNSGYVGIGTNNPSNKLVVGDDSTGATLVPGYSLSIGHTSGDSAFQMGTGSATKGYMKWINSTNTFQLGTTSPNYPLAIQTAGGNVGIGTSTPPEKLWVEGRIGSSCSTGSVETQSISAIGWYNQGISWNCPVTDASKMRIVLTQDNNGTGDISIISTRIRKNDINTNHWSFEYYVNAVPTPGTTKFNYIIFHGAF